jgi:hypothetical protein
LPASAGPQPSQPSVDEICRTLAQAAADNDLPEEFFTRLIWQESRFDPKAVSPKGAQGIAQFMPQTAAMRGLVNAFEPLEALRESASYLRELRTTFRGQPGARRGGLQCRPRRRSKPGSPAAYPAVRDPGLCPHRHRLRRGGLDGEADAADGASTRRRASAAPRSPRR